VGFGVTDQIFRIHQILGKKWEYKREYISHLDTSRKVLYNILIEFRVPRNLVRVIRMCSNKLYSKVCMGTHLSDIIPLQSGLNQGDALSPLLFSYGVKYAIRKARKTRCD
jgi:hypothetical protein